MSALANPDLPGAIDRIRDLTTAGEEPQILIPGYDYGFLVPPGYDLERIDTRPLADAPTRKRGLVTVHTGPSFAQYVNRHLDPHAVLYADVTKRAVVGVLNDHASVDTGDAPGWADHRVTLQLRHDPAWADWAAIDGNMLPQVDFAEFVEDHTLHIVDPPAAHVLQMAQKFRAATKVNFSTSKLLESGETQLVYEETIDARAGAKGDITIPQELTVELPIFEGEPPVTVIARFRYRMREGRLTLGVKLMNAEDRVREAFTAILDDIEVKTGLTALRGTPISNVAVAG